MLLLFCIVDFNPVFSVNSLYMRFLPCYSVKCGRFFLIDNITLGQSDKFNLFCLPPCLNSFDLRLQLLDRTSRLMWFSLSMKMAW